MRRRAPKSARPVRSPRGRPSRTPSDRAGGRAETTAPKAPPAAHARVDRRGARGAFGQRLPVARGRLENELSDLMFPLQEEHGQRAFGPAPVGAARPAVFVPARASAGRHQLACGAGDPLRLHPAQGPGRQPDLGRRTGTVDPDVVVADVLAAGAEYPGVPQSTPARRAGVPELSPVTPAPAPTQLLKPLRPRLPANTTRETKVQTVQARSGALQALAQAPTGS
jgi:hypothetical protein